MSKVEIDSGIAPFVKPSVLVGVMINDKPNFMNVAWLTRLAFKPNTDDMREAVSIKIINKLLRGGADIIAYDPKAMHNANETIGNRIKYASSEIECIKDAVCCIIVTEWDEFKRLRPEAFIQNMRQPCLIDGRRIYDPKIFNPTLKFIAVGMDVSKAPV